MPLQTIAVPAVANVPVAPGVPPMVGAGTIIESAVLLTADATSLARSMLGPQWGLFTTAGAPAIVGDSVISVDYRRESKISDYPVEKGGFDSYNKVQLPADVRITFASSGVGSIFSSLTSGGAIGAALSGVDDAQANRTAFLASVEAAANSLTLFNAVTPEATYSGYNIIHYDYRRTAKNGATLILVEIWLEEVRVSATGTFTATKAANGASPQSGGTVQPTAPTAAQSAAVSSGVAAAAGNVGASAASGAAGAVTNGAGGSIGGAFGGGAAAPGPATTGLGGSNPIAI
jgi:hypothetical protein